MMLVTSVTITPILKLLITSSRIFWVGHHQFEICEIEFVFNPEGFLENIEEWIYEKDSKEEYRQPENQCD